MTAVMTFTCSICGESSQEICVFCTKDTCENHMCERCHRCSDCCICESPIIREKAKAAPVEEPLPEPETGTEEAAIEDEEDLEDEGFADETQGEEIEQEKIEEEDKEGLV